MLDVHRLRILRELDRRGTLAEVAKALTYSPSAISQQLSQLESETGVQLLQRVGRGVRLTRQARVLVRHTEVILEQLETAEAELAASLTEVGGTLRVASFQTVLLALVPATLTRLAQAHPQLRVEITRVDPEAAFPRLTAHDVDVVLGEEYPDHPVPPVPGVDEEDLLRDGLRLAVPRAGPLAGARSLADLAGAPWVLEPTDNGFGRWSRTALHAAGVEPDVRFEISDLLLHAHLVRTGHAVALLPDLLGSGADPGVDLIDLPGRPVRRLYTGVRRGSARHPAVRAFRESLRHALPAAS